MTVKQNPLQTTSSFHRSPGLFLALCFSCTAGLCAGGSAEGAESGRSTAQPAIAKTALSGVATSVRLIDGTGLDHGTYVAGVEITMAPGSHTYWKMPGDAGVPPVFAFNGSENVDSAKVLFPTPKRITDDGIVAFGYTGTVVFPVMVTPKDASKPASLRVDVNYAVCSKICLPAHGGATLMLRPAGTGASPKTIDAALSKVPVPMAPNESKLLTITPDKGAKKPTWTLSWHGDTPVVDIFADAPEGFAFDTTKIGAGAWRLVAATVVSSPTSKPVPVTLTLARPNGSGLAAIEKLDATTPTQ